MPRTQVKATQVADELTSADFASSHIDGAANVASLRTLGLGAQQAAAGDHSHVSWQTITDGATVTLSWKHGSVNVATLGGNRTLAISGTPAIGEQCQLRISQDGTGNRTLTWPTSGVTIKWPLGEVPVLTTTASKTDTFRLTCIDATSGALIFAGVIESMNEG